MATKVKLLLLSLLLLPTLVFGQTVQTLTGRVTDEKTGEPLVGVNVMLKGNGSIGAITDVDGIYTLKNVPADAVLVFSNIGSETREVAVGGKSVLDVVLAEDTQLLEETVVVGYGTQKKVNLTGAVAQVKMDEIVGNRPVTSIADALLGNVPGLVLSGNTGEPGSGYNFQIRGTSSINGGSPLILVDGISMDISSLNPNDIESISVLKDASASAIYGARAAFGVILVTTKKSALERKPSISFSSKFSFSAPQSMAQRATVRQNVQALKDTGEEVFIGGQDYTKWLEFIGEYEADPSRYPEGYAEYNGARYALAQTDVTRDLITTGMQQIYDLAVTGGSERTKYRIAGGVAKEDGVLATNKDSYSRFNVSSFVSSNVTNWLTAELTSMYTHTDKLDPDASGYNGRDIWAMTVFLPSFAPTDGIVINDKFYRYFTPVHLLESIVPRSTKYDRLNLIGRLILNPFKGMTVTGEYSVNRTFYTNTSYSKRIDDFADTRDNTMVPANNPYSTYRLQKSDTDYSAANVYATYKNTLGRHDFTLMSGINVEQYYNESMTTSRAEMINDEMPSLSQAVGTINTSDSYTQNAVFGVFYRANYAFAERYLLEATGRYDGSSKFPKSNRFGFFPSFSVGWRIDKEPFAAGWTAVDNLKIRASWGNIGNQSISDYAYLPTMASEKASWGLNLDKPITLGSPALVRSNFTWETVRTTNAGIDWGFFKNRLTGSFDIFRRETLGMLAPGPEFPTVLGASSPMQNAADMRSDGWEFQILWRDRVGRVDYSLGFHVSDATSVVTKYNNPTKSLSMSYYEGKVLGEIWGYVSDRLYTVDDFVEGTLSDTGAGRLTGGTLKEGLPRFKGYDPNPGDMMYKYADEEGNVWSDLNTVDNPGSRRIIGNSTPRYNFGISGSISYRGWDLSFLFQGVGKRDLWMRNSLTTPIPSGNDFAIYTELLDYWTPENPNAHFTRLYPKRGYNNGANAQVQTRYLFDGSFLDLRSLALSYSFPERWMKKIGVGGASLFVNGENLFSLNHLPKGLHPSSTTRGAVSGVGEGGSIYPVMRKITVGFNVRF